VFRETRAASEVPVTFCAGVASTRERVRRASHTVATLLVAGVRDVTCTCLVAPSTHEISSHGTCKICDYMIMSSTFSHSILILLVGSTCPPNMMLSQFSPWQKNLLLPKVFLETDYFMDSRPVRQIYAGTLEYGLDHLMYLPALAIRPIIMIIT